MKKIFKKFKFIFKFSAIFLLIAVLGFSNIVSLLPQVLQNNKLAESLKIQEARAAIIAQYTGGLLVYADTVTVGTPKYQVFDDTTGFGAEQSAQSVGASAINWIRVAASPVNDEWIIATRDAGNVIKAQVCTGIDGGVSCGTPTTITATAGTHGFNNFDVAYEQTSGDALLVYGTATVDELRKIERTGGAWTLDAAITTNRTAGTVEWVELTSRNSSNQIGIVYSDDADDVSAYRWDGTTAANEYTAAITTAASIGNVRKVDVSFEGTSGDMLVSAALEAAGSIALGALTAAGVWSLPSGAATDNDASFIDLQEPNPSDDDIAIVTMGDLAASNPFEGSEYSGAGLVDGTVAVDTTATLYGASYHMAATAYVNTTYYAVAVFSDVTGADDINWFTMNNAGTWAAVAADNLRTRGTMRFLKLFDYPSLGKVLLISSDANSDLWADTWDGTTPSSTVWVDRTSGGARETDLSIATKDVVDFAFRLAPPPVVNTLTIGVTAGSKVSTVNSGDTSVYANATSCAASSTCAAFTLNVSNTSVTVSSIKITETGTATATTDLSQLALFYDTDGNYSNGVTGQYGTTVASFTSEAATVSGSLALTAATTYYFYVRFNASSTTTYPKGGQTVNFQIAANADVTLSSGSATISGAPQSMAGTTTILPKVSSVSYGAGLSDGARSSEAITVSGYGFGVAPGGSRASCAGAVDTGCVRFLVGGAATVADASVSSWSNTSIGWTVSSTLASNGGVSSLEIVSGAQGTATDTTYYIYPNITAISATAAREYDSGDTDGLVMLSGNHFGSTQGTVSSTGAFGNGNLAIHSTAEGGCTTGGWSAASYSGNTVCIEITPASIPDSVYSGSITLNRNADSKTDVESNFGIMPRIISNANAVGGAASGIIGDVIQLKGNHFCQSGTCPVSPNRSDASNNVKFGNTTSTDSDFVNQTGGAGACNGAGAAWTNTEICVKVPAGTPAGSASTTITSNTYGSNAKAFTVLSSVPNNPDLGPGTDKGQFKSDGSTAIGVGSSTNQSTVVFKMLMSVGPNATLEPQVEIASTSIAFVNSPTATGTAVAYTGTPVTGTVTISGIIDNTYHWQARVRNVGTGEYSNWVSFGGNNDPNDTDFRIDTTGPTIYFLPSQQLGICSDSQTNLGANGITITWYLSESADGQVEYSTSTDLSGSANYPSSPAAPLTSHAITLSNLNSNTTYNYKVKSRDGAGNLANRPTAQPYCQFQTSSVNQPAKTTQFHATSTTGFITGGTTASSTFTVFMPENATSTQSAFLEISAISNSGGTNNFAVWINSQASKTYVINAASITYFKVLYKIEPANLNTDPVANVIYLNPSISTYVVSAKVVVTYAYTP